jgi:membrane-associated phospholipid phosphatase
MKPKNTKTVKEKLSSTRVTVDDQLPIVSARRPWGYIATLVIGLVLLGVSAALAHASPSTLTGWEQRAFNLINGVTMPLWVAEQLAKPISNAVLGMVGLVVVLLVVPKFRWRAWQYVVAGGGAFVLATLVEHVVGRARPAGLTHQVVLRAMQDGLGYPSTHVAIATALGLTVWLYVSWPLRIVSALFISAVAWSRMFLGVHAPLDIIGGFAVGMIVVALVHLLPIKIRSFFKLSA